MLATSSLNTVRDIDKCWLSHWHCLYSGLKQKFQQLLHPIMGLDLCTYHYKPLVTRGPSQSIRLPSVLCQANTANTQASRWRED